MASNGSFGCGVYTIFCTFTFLRSGAVKHFVITTPVHQVSTANIKFEAAKGFGTMTG